MGEKYQAPVLKFLTTDFGLERMAPEESWLHASNWHVVKELEDCCV
jgi:hypothetical protein